MKTTAKRTTTTTTKVGSNEETREAGVLRDTSPTTTQHLSTLRLVSLMFMFIANV